MSKDSYPAQALDHDKKLSMAFFTFLDLKTNWPELSSITDSIMDEGSEFGANSDKFTKSAALAAIYTFLEIRAPLGSGIRSSTDCGWGNVPGVLASGLFVGSVGPPAATFARPW
jgi:hypothetical protein